MNEPSEHLARCFKRGGRLLLALSVGLPACTSHEPPSPPKSHAPPSVSAVTVTTRPPAPWPGPRGAYAFAEGESGPAAVRAVGMYLARLRRALTLHKSGAGLQEAAKASGVFWKQEREFLRQARAWSLEALDVVQPEVLQADRLCKQTGTPDTLIAERLVLTVAARAKRLGL